MRGNGAATDKLRADLETLGTDMGQLLRTTTDQGGQRIAQVRAKAQESLNEAMARLSDLQEVTLAKARAAGQATDDFARANPWRLIAISAAAGFVLGLLLVRGGDSKP